MWLLFVLGLVSSEGIGLPLIDGDTDCPSAAQVEAALRLLGVPSARPERVALHRTDGALQIELRTITGERLASRSLPRDESCSDLASAVAIVIASWQAELPRTPTTMIHLDRTAGRDRGLRYDVGAAFLASIDTRFAAGALTEATLAPTRSRWGARVGAFATATRDLPIGGAHVSWTRAALFAGPRLRLTHKRWLLDLDADVALGLLYARGVGLAIDRVAYNVDPGLLAGARVAVHWGPVAPLLSVAVVGWLRRQEFDLAGPLGPIAENPPQWELLFGAGLMVGAFR